MNAKTEVLDSSVPPLVRRAEERDIERIAEINAEVFNGNRDNLPAAREWVGALFRAYPVYQYFVVEHEGKVAGFAGWQVEGGLLRPLPVLELEQFGISREFQGFALARPLFEKGMNMACDWLQERNSRIESHIHIVIWVYANNEHARRVYERLLGTEGEEAGMCKRYGDREEVMYRYRIPMVRRVRSEVLCGEGLG